MAIYSTKNAFSHESTPIFGLKMFLLSFISILPCIMIGFGQAYTAVALPQMKLSIDDASWFSAILNVTSPIGTILFSVIIDIYGRKTALMSSILPHVFGWTLIYFNLNKSVLFIGRMLTGFSTQSQTYSARVYLTECVAVNHIRLRSFLLVWVSITTTSGVLCTYILSYFLNYLHLAAFAALLSLILLLAIFIILPESPTWLYLQGRNGDAELAQRKLNISQQPLLQRLPANDFNSSVSERNTLNSDTFVLAIKKIVTRADVRKPLIIMTIVTTLAIATGGYALVAYMSDVIGSGKSYDSHTTLLAAAENVTENAFYNYGLISAIFAVAAQVAQCILLPHLGTKFITIVACCCMSVGLCMLGLIDATATMSRGSVFLWHVAAVWFVIFAFYFGVHSVPMTVIGEIFPADAKGMAGIPVCTMVIAMAIMLKIHPYLYLQYGIYLYYIYAAVAATEAVFVFFFMPETVGKTLKQINGEFL